jgi:hypothetical protein
MPLPSYPLWLHLQLYLAKSTNFEAPHCAVLSNVITNGCWIASIKEIGYWARSCSCLTSPALALAASRSSLFSFFHYVPNLATSCYAICFLTKHYFISHSCRLHIQPIVTSTWVA